MLKALFCFLVLCMIVAQPDPLAASPAYRSYAEGLIANLPKGARFRPDLEAKLNALAASARARAGKPRLKASRLLRKAARAQAVEMLRGNFVGHRSKSGFRYKARFEAFAGDEHGDHGENAARDRQPGPVNSAKARRLFQQWLDSRGHKRNLMNRYYRFVSTGAVQIGHHLYAVQIFWEK
ncbi:MAG: CAP domain-containing protein [Aestuariivirgaceae bacterium]